MFIQMYFQPPKSCFNKFGNYAYRNCEDILEALKPLLNEVKAIVNISDDVVLVGERYYIKATVKFIDAETGEVVEASAMAREEESKKGMDASQLTGSTSSYARKYALNGLFAIDDTKDSDTTNTHGKEDSKSNVITLTDKQLNRMYAIAKVGGYDKVKVDRLINQKYSKKANEMTKEEYDNVVEGLQKIADVKTKEKFIASEKKFIKNLVEDQEINVKIYFKVGA